MTILVTGAAGFIGYHASLALLKRGEEVVGVDNLNDYYDPALKHARVASLQEHKGFHFYRADIADYEALSACVNRHSNIRNVVHLAAQPGVRYSLEKPFAYSASNLTGHLSVLELCRHLGAVEHMVYASSSSVYGGNTKLPFSENDDVSRPVSLYAATKRSAELMSHTYAHLYNLNATGLRFFTVYGPWGRPDMAAWLFTSAISEERPISVFNHGNMRRDFTYIDDIISGLLAVLDGKPRIQEVPHRVYNIGNHRSEALLDFISEIESAVGKKAIVDLQPMQPGDVHETYADISAIQRDFGFAPTTSIQQGIPKFVEWYQQYQAKKLRAA